ncbi:MAG TPA: YbhB/YbcL family Raf kinase inhibitor-like protein [Nitrosopumilaceae archaeon]|nr:YbhB/YbcL family Raf kinase inhibitor-like protein [Nitrosopumilaceae archaeon]
MEKLTIESLAFTNGGEIPKKYGYKHDNINPPIKIRGVPSEANSLALIMDDPDAMKAVGKVWVHWLVWNIDPKTLEISEDSVPSGSIEGKTDFDEIGYGGPAPPDKRHTYDFKLFALKSKLELKQGSNKDQLENAMKGKILEQAILKGTFAP